MFWNGIHSLLRRGAVRRFTACDYFMGQV